jgi:ATP-citrate lyase beta-subunit
MAQKAIREYYGKKLLFSKLPMLMDDFKQSYEGLLIDSQIIPSLSNWPDFESGYVVKPDELFGKRGKNGLVFINKDKKAVLDWIRKKSNGKTTIKQNERELKGKLRYFLIEPFVEHDNEYYLSMNTTRETDTIRFSAKGGVEVEENWKDVIDINIPFVYKQVSINKELEKNLSKKLPDVHRTQIIRFISAVYEIFKNFDFTYLEINPFVINENEVSILDLVARIDSTSVYKNRQLYHEIGEPEFPAPFGGEISLTESKIEQLDESSGASLKYRLINPEGKVWFLTSGGGGSVIFADTVGDLGYHSEIANYTDYSGNPNTDETQEFCEIIFSDMFKSKRKDKVLIVGGGIANFTDIAKTFTGVARAIEKHHKRFIDQKIKIFVRRGGPNYKRGLEFMQTIADKYQIPISVHGPEMYMTEVVKTALEN